MEIALSEAAKAAESGEVPVGALIVRDNQIIAKAHNQIEMLNDSTSHAEILVIKEASKKLNNWRLNGCTLVCTLEPCTMCLGAIKQSRISTIVFGAKDPRFGACGSLYDLAKNPSNGSVPEIFSDVMAEDCKKLMQEFFRKIRN